MNDFWTNRRNAATDIVSERILLRYRELLERAVRELIQEEIEEPIQEEKEKVGDRGVFVASNRP